ncbi:MAG TPA: hypothetical protein ENJ82_10830 [Bacteroidetes bacterium]|nr:hypothetical protein [Bacteroidota bacterium]
MGNRTFFIGLKTGTAFLLLTLLSWSVQAQDIDSSELIPDFSTFSDSVKIEKIKAYLRQPKVKEHQASQQAACQEMIKLSKASNSIRAEAYAQVRLYNVLKVPEDTARLKGLKDLIATQYYEHLACKDRQEYHLITAANWGRLEQQDLAQKAYHRTLKLSDSCSLSKQGAYNGLAVINNWLGRDSLALAYMLLCVDELLVEEEVDSIRLSLIYNNISIQYSQLANDDSSLVYVKRSLALLRHPRSLIRLANLLMRQKRFQKAEKNLQETEVLIRKNPAFAKYEKTLVMLQSRLYLKTGQYDLAVKKSEIALDLALKRGNIQSIYYGYGGLVQAHLANKAYLADSLEVFGKRLNDEQVQQSTLEEQARFKTLEKEKEILRQEKEILELNGDLKDQEIETLQVRSYLIYGAVGALLLALLLYVWVRRRQVRAGRELEKLRKQAVKLQMNPHFFFNSLNSIQLFIAKNEKGLAQKYLVNFSKLMRLTLENSQEDTISIQKEMDFLHNYLVLEQLRMKNFDFEFKVAEDIKELRIPGLLIQPLVENSLLHGFADIEYRGLLRISILKAGNDLRVEVLDNGLGKEKTQAARAKVENGHRSFALGILQKRLANYSQNAVEIVYSAGLKAGDNLGTKVSFLFPIIH